ncbi:hypothetical protein JR316_0002209 [Psilocybe cubensis]|uniref:Uncharacterized protein n=2 Tax=Psilocybe cubensis TaxID=181762 RepID=A0ACB8HBJ4_PSICU|nr:hypothetical protein JR316_0002209 [Psilocybe cubensis]KAH9485301.1 hypothetical protein JR316_0002209 [Psilocybe cubensis]
MGEGRRKLLMASLSDQIDRLTRNTRLLKETAAQVAPAEAKHAVIFTNAVLNTHLGDLIRDIDPSELGLFRLVQNDTSNTYDKDSRSITEPQIRRTQFVGATPLRKNPARREERYEIEPEVYAHAALKYIEQYEPIRPMPRAYDQIVTILNKIHDVREHIKSLNATLEQTVVSNKQPPPKLRLEQEERRIHELEARIAELNKKKELSTDIKKPKAPRPKNVPNLAEKALLNPPSVSSPQEEKFWATPGEPSRVLRFSDNLLDEEVNLGDVSTASFGSPVVGSSQLRPTKLFDEIDAAINTPVAQPNPFFDEGPTYKAPPSIDSNPPTDLVPTQEPLPPPSSDTPHAKSSPTLIANVTETPSVGQKKVKVNIEVERIVSKIWSTVGDIIGAPSELENASSPSVNDTVAHLQHLATQFPSPDSPIASTASSTAVEGTNGPTAQQIQIAYLITMLLAATPHHSMPLNQVKENLDVKAKAMGQGPTRVLFGCVAKRLLKIERGRREQIVKFDI